MTLKSMTSSRDEITAKIDDIQAALNQVSQQLLSQSPQAQNLIGQLQAYNQMLSEPETKPVGKK
jgi:septal ring factor EnvC (AmiA/AmiB activator)|tara:strand:+ start:66 stop:257 length:192 start_codon:yes stop_codon:yes gene_type:complete